MRKLLLASSAVATIGCVDAPTATLQSMVARQPNLAGSGATLVECPTDQTSQATALVTPLGGMVSSGGTTINVPAGAVLVPTNITVTVPASNYMEVDISAEGASHFTFQTPVAVTISYARCSRSNIDRGPLTVWNIDTATKALIENMGGTDDKTARAVTFSTGHLTGYAIAN